MKTALGDSSGNLDTGVDKEIQACLELGSLKSFFLFAGAGSGKTRSLVAALRWLRDNYGRRLSLYGKRVAVITYTNAARDEIKQRLDFSSIADVSTIHSFVWSLIGNFHADINVWVRANLEAEIADIQALQAKGRQGKASADRAKSIESKLRRLSELDGIVQFTYSPNGDNRSRDSLNHAEVIKIGAEFLVTRPVMQKILVGKYPILLIDESQDTNRLLMEGFLEVQRQHSDRFCIGLFGDTMQRIYADGKPDLGRQLPEDWATPRKLTNHRSPRRIVSLINKIRSSVDQHEQVAVSDRGEGFARLFVLSDTTKDKIGAESEIRHRMADLTGDPLWFGNDEDVKTLILEHHMAARRLRFIDMFEPLYAIDQLRTSLLDGSLAGLRFFIDLVLPLIQANRDGDQFRIAAVVRSESPLLEKAALASTVGDQRSMLRRANAAVGEIVGLWRASAKPRFIDVLRCIDKSGLFDVPDVFRPICARSAEEQADTEAFFAIDAASEAGADPTLEAWDRFLVTAFDQIEPYAAYISGKAAFDTHQGVKGLEFPRVLVVMDDTEARGFLFSYEKLFGVMDKTKTYIENERAGKDTSIERTRRLFYVTCSRAEQSLAIAAYSGDPMRLRKFVIDEGWFDASEVQIVA
jgi:DNA helicase II / ATP-dependent DNA helicase PcrA